MAASSMRHLDSEARAIRHEFRKSVYGTKVESSLWKQCISLVGFNSYSQSNFVYAASRYGNLNFVKFTYNFTKFVF